ncbi:ropporin-1-like protein [Anomaloglossus baeobatrachus]|uniref:ropporin-1-like protein n=1 Tax=Anomaloglossus baeobatrachus TaxID=238106 RepID=UPI003F4FFC5C
MPLPEPMFCPQQIAVPPELPELLKQFTKAAIRTQPADTLQWSAAYFRSLSRGEPLPVKDRVEMPVATQRTDSGLSPGLLRVLHRQLGGRALVPAEELEQRWRAVCLPQAQLLAILALDDPGREVEWMKFLALACSSLGGSITTALKFACEILSEDPEGGAARIPYQTFVFLYKYLAQVDGDIADSTIGEALSALQAEAGKQGGMVQPRNFLSPQCPPLS